jgi:CubicO group peptidase (beta-lactamase class C family)
MAVVQSGCGQGRRAFLQASACGLLGGLFVPIAGCSKEKTRPEGAPETLIAQVEDDISTLMRATSAPGLSVAVIKSGELLWRKGFGLKDATAPDQRVDDDTVFEAQSMSKPVFAYVVMKLCEKGVLNLDTPLTKYTDRRFLAADSRLDLITARHVLSHTTGFQNWRSATEPLKIHFTPGERYMYSGEGYNYLQSVVTHLTGHVNTASCARFEDGLEVCATDIDQYMKANLLVPFGMESSSYLPDDTIARRMARPHDRQGQPIARGKPTAIDAARYAAAGALLTTPTDYARFLIEVIAPKPADAFRLELRTRDEMIRPHVAVNDTYGSSWALGWQVQKTGIINHGGDIAGFHSMAVASPRTRSGFVIMTNGDNGGEILGKLILSDTPLNRLID